jgi:hypothetical protein
MLFTAPAAHAEFRWAANAGVNITNLHFKQDLVSVDQSVGYGAGILGEMMFPGVGFGLDFGLGYDQEGATVGLGERKIWEGYGSPRLYIHNITIPIHLRFKYTRLNGWEEKIAPIVYAGPEFNIQAAHSKCDAIDFSGGDMGLAVGIGAEIYRNWQVTCSYTWGMTYALKTKLLENFSAQTRRWALRVSYLF